MIMLADECIFQITVDKIRIWGFNIYTVQEKRLMGEKNGELLNYAKANKMVFLTRDKDFTDIRIYPPSDYYGIIVLKITPINQNSIFIFCMIFLE